MIFFKYSTLIYRNSILMTSSWRHKFCIIYLLCSKYMPIFKFVWNLQNVFFCRQSITKKTIFSICFCRLRATKQYYRSASRTVLYAPPTPFTIADLREFSRKVCFFFYENVVFSVKINIKLKHILVCNVTYFTLFTLHDKLHIFPD